MPMSQPTAMLSRGIRWFPAILLLMTSHLVLAGSGSEPLNVTYRTSTSEVRITFFTTDKQNRFIANVGKDDFAVIDGDMVVRDFRSLTRAEETALEVVILVDASASIANRLQPTINDVLRLISRTQANARVSVASFAGLQPTMVCSGDCESAQATQELRAIASAGPTPLYDTLAYASEFISKRSTPDVRPVLILFSDGDDTISKISAQEALQAMISAGAFLYAIDVTAIDLNPGGKNKDQSQGSGVLWQMAAATGGRYFSTREQAANVLQSALEDLRASYVVTYELPSRAGGFHPLRILPKHNPNLQFHCRSGYFYGTP